MARARKRLAEVSAKCRRGRGGLGGLVSRPSMDITHLDRGKKKSVQEQESRRQTPACSTCHHPHNSQDLVVECN